jgi:serine/threonine protein kinase
MGINAGARLGRYEILSPLGAGGMGEVYLAKDTRLERTVALKILPAKVATDESRMRRFTQEARAASALSHPNVAHIYEIEEDAGVHFIAMEYIEGRTLRQHLKDSPLLGPREALEIAMQVAAALAAAHAAGIVHRDIKPENIMLRPDGYVKVLDFGLAKLTERQTADTDTEAPTKALVNTDPGAVLGTASYMSPEQARGCDVDARTDIWSLGVVLYEMVAGRAPFEGMTSSDMIASILSKEPPPLARFSREAPEALELIVSTALAKDREERYQSAKEMLGALRRLKQRIDLAAEMERSLTPEQAAAATTTDSQGRKITAAQDSALLSTQTQTAGTTSSAEVIISEIKRHKRAALLLGTAIVVVIVGLAFGLYKLIGQKQPGPVTPLQSMKFIRLTTSGKATSAAISPDGKYVVYALDDAGQQSLWLRQVATESNVQIVPPGSQPYSQAAFSPDGNFVYFARRAGVGIHRALYRVPVLGGAPTKINSDAIPPVTLSPDGRRVAYSRDKPGSNECALFVSNLDGAGEEKLAAVNRPEHILRAAWSPDGTIIAYLVGRLLRRTDIFALGIEDKTARLIISQDGWVASAGMAWLADGSGLIIAASDRPTSLSTQLWQVSYPGGETRRITNDPNSYRDVSIAADSSKLVTLQTSRTSTIWVMPTGDSSRAQQSTGGVGQSDGESGISWTGDGRIVYSSGTDHREIWIADSNGKNQRQLTTDGKMSVLPSVTPDGRYIVYNSFRSGMSEIWRMDIEGGNSKQLTSGGGREPVCLPDGKWVVYESGSSDRLELWKIPLEGGQPLLLTAIPSLSSWALSPDGKLLAKLFFSEEEDVPPKLEVIALEEGQTAEALNIPPTVTRLGWTPDGRAIAYIDTRGGVANLWAQPLDGGPAKQLTNFNSDLIYSFAWSRDGKQLALSRGKRNSDVVLISDFR